MSDTVKVIALFAAGIAIVLAGKIYVSSVRCQSEWADYKPTYGLASGCQIEVNGKMTPTSAIREIRP